MLRIILKRLILFVLSVFAWGCASTQGIDERSAIAIGVRDQHFFLTVPESKLGVRLPRGFARASPPERGGATLSLRYFFFVDEARGIVLSGWFEPDSRFKGAKTLWEETLAARPSTWPRPQDVSFSNVAGWDTISFTLASPPRSNAHLWAHWIQAGTWIELHLSCSDNRTTAEQHATLVEVLRTVEVSEKTPTDTTARRAFEDMRARAEKGEAFAQQVIGVSYLLGTESTARDHVEARFWIRKAAEQGDRISQKFLGMMYEQGWGGSQDYAEALVWYRKAAEQGDANSQSSLGAMYADGRGVPQDPVRAYMWISLALGERSPERALPEDAKNKATASLATLAQGMAPEQLEQAQAMARACRLAQYQHCDQSPTGAQASESRPAVPGVEDQVTVRAMSVRLPAAEGWRKREVPMKDGGVLFEIERDLPTGNRVQIHVADYYGPSRLLATELWMSGLSDAERLDLFLKKVVGPTLFSSKEFRHSEWVETQRDPQRRFGAACRENHALREDRAENGRLFLWQDWMLFCVDPVSHIPIEVDYAERYPAEGRMPSPSFSEDAAAFFDSVQVHRTGLTMRPVAEVTAAFIQANNKLFSDIDREDYPATVVFSLDPSVKDSTLQNLAQRLFRLKGTDPKDCDENAIAKHLTDERAFMGLFLVVPESISQSDKVFVGDAVIRRRLLPKGHIGRGSGYGDFLLRFRVYPATEHRYELGHVGIQWLK